MIEVQIAPSILAADFTQLGAQLQDAQRVGAAMIHIDVMDGRFVPNITMGGVVIEAARRATQLPLDVHLMMIEPDHLIPSFAEAGADHISVHYEACPDLQRTLTLIQRQGCKAGVAINPHTPAWALSEILPLLDEVVVMTVSPGFGGQKLISHTLGKIAALRAMANERHHYELNIVADGGVNVETASSVAQAGANILVVGSAFFNNQPMQANMRALQDAAQSR